MTERLLTVAEVADLLRLNQQTIRNWIDDGKLPAVRVGRRVRIRDSEVQALLGPPSQFAGPGRRAEGGDDAVERESPSASRTFDAAIARLERFRAERDWRQYHTLTDLAAGIAIEAGELQESHP